MTQTLGFMNDTNYRVRIRGTRGGGWKGNPRYRGTVRFTVDASGNPVHLHIANVPLLFESYGQGTVPIHSVDMWSPEQQDIQDYSFCVRTKKDSILLQLHRDDLDKMATYEGGVMVGSAKPQAKKTDFDKMLESQGLPSNAAAAEISKARSTGELSLGVLEGQGFVAYECSEREHRFIQGLESSLLDLDKTDSMDIFNFTPTKRARALAVALIRLAVRNPGVRVPFAPLPEWPWMPSPDGVKTSLVVFLTTTGLGRFASVGGTNFAVHRPTESAELYDYTRISEPWRAPLAEFRLDAAPPEEIHAVQDEQEWGDFMKEALSVSKKVEGLQAPAQPSGPSPLDLSRTE